MLASLALEGFTPIEVVHAFTDHADVVPLKA